MMNPRWTVVAMVIAAIALGPMLVLIVECFASLLPRRSRGSALSTHRPAATILIPARNEGRHIGRALDSLRPQLGDGDRMLVIADNCSDDTALIARAGGASVLERRNLDQVGKSYAVAFGVECLSTDPPEVVVIVDGDCVVEAGAIDALVRCADATRGPVQGRYVQALPPDPGARDLISGFAFTLKNVTRPTGLDRLGLPCFLNGSGMAFPWFALGAVQLANGRLSDDRWLTVDLALTGRRTTFCDEACVRGELPHSQRAASEQRKRWSHGDLEALLVLSPRLLKAAAQQRRIDLLALALHVGVPPLSLLAGIWISASALLFIFAVAGGSWFPIGLTVSGGLLTLGSVFGVWARLMRQDIPLRALLAIPVYVAWSLTLQLSFATRRQRRWFRPDRDQPVPHSPP